MIGVRVPGFWGETWPAVDRRWKTLEGWLFDAKHVTYGLSLLRILYGLLIIGLLDVNFADRQYIWGIGSRWLQPLVAEEGFTRPFTLLSGNSPLFSGNSPRIFTATYLLMGFVALLFTLGWRTRLVTPVLLVLWVSLTCQNPLLTDAGDTVVRLVLFYLCFADVSAHWSLDARRHTRAASNPDRVRRIALPSGWGNWGNLFHNAAVIAVACQVFIIYVSSAMFKTQGSLWQNGTAIYYPMRMHSYEAFPMLNDVLSSNVFILFVATYASVFLQLFFPFLLLTRPTRILALVGIMAMHVGIAITLALPFFSLSMIGADVIFVRDRTFSRVESKIKRLLRGNMAGRNRDKGRPEREFVQGEADGPAPHESVLIYDGDCGFCRRTLDAMKRRLARWPRTAPYQRLNLDQHGVRSQEAAKAMLWVEPGMPTLIGAAAFARLFREQPQLRWRTLGRIMALPGISHLAAIVYRVVARHRHRLLSGASACQRPLAEVREAPPEPYFDQTSPAPGRAGQS
ncbi:MAG TPA: HTTM domain-containing protein [Streptosporangiaceae bacterium]|nr:HTTM domain-containing protein [Streptosporangiaceae bacterium]